MPYLGYLSLADIHDGTLQPYTENLRSKGRNSKTVNKGLELVRRILKKAATKWRDDLTSKTWIASIPVIENIDWNDTRTPSAIYGDEQALLISELAYYLVEPVLFALNTGYREQEICQLRWEWEVKVSELNSSVFVLPDWNSKK